MGGKIFSILMLRRPFISCETRIRNVDSTVAQLSPLLMSDVEDALSHPNLGTQEDLPCIFLRGTVRHLTMVITGIFEFDRPAV